MSLARAEEGFGVLLNLLRCLEVVIVDPQVLVLALVGRVVAAYLRPSFVTLAEVVGPQVLAHGMNQQIPGVFLGEHRGPFVQRR